MIAIVPARGGSKGLPGKNVKPLNGKPLIAYSVEAALKAKNVSEVIVSTDDPEIAEVAVQHGAINPFLRPEELATDSAMAIDNYQYTIERLSKERGEKIEDFIVLLPTAPLRLASDIDEAIDLFYAKKADSVVSYTPEHHPISWHKYLDEEGKFVEILTGAGLKNRQDLKESYYPNGAIFIFNYENSIAKGKYYTDESYAYVMPRNRSVDIDTLEDFEYAEYLLNKR